MIKVTINKTKYEFDSMEEAEEMFPDIGTDMDDIFDETDKVFSKMEDVFDRVDEVFKKIRKIKPVRKKTPERPYNSIRPTPPPGRIINEDIEFGNIFKTVKKYIRRILK